MALPVILTVIVVQTESLFRQNYTIRKQAEQAKLLQQAVGVPVAAQTQPTVLQPCINAWISGDILPMCKSRLYCGG